MHWFMASAIRRPPITTTLHDIHAPLTQLIGALTDLLSVRRYDTALARSHGGRETDALRGRVHVESGVVSAVERRA